MIHCALKCYLSYYTKLQHFHPKCDQVSLSHRCFTDDLLIFSKATPSSLQDVKQVMKEFHSLSGLRVSYTKSELFYSRISLEEQNALADMLRLKLGKLPVRYLRVPLICKKLSEVDCKPLIEKMTSRISSWTTRFLSFASRMQLIQAVLQSMYSYGCTVFLLPKKVVRAVESICRSFPWKGVVKNALGAKVS